MTYKLAHVIVEVKLVEKKLVMAKNKISKNRKIISLIVLFGILVSLLIWSIIPPPIELFARSAIVMDADSGRIIFEKNMHSRLTPSSMTKLMALLLVFENIENGNLSLDEMVVASRMAVSTIASRAGIREGEAHTVETLIILALLLFWLYFGDVEINFVYSDF